MNDYIYSLSDTQKTSFLEDGNMHEHKTTLKSYIRIHPVQVILVFVALTASIAVACTMLFHARRIHKKMKRSGRPIRLKRSFLPECLMISGHR
ncbi:MAG TPA: hypothetical protein DCZ78_06520 [Blautia sp.]|nr:hypothetical protein [Blautia sp.]